MNAGIPRIAKIIPGPKPPVIYFILVDYSTGVRKSEVTSRSHAIEWRLIGDVGRLPPHASETVEQSSEVYDIVLMCLCSNAFELADAATVVFSAQPWRRHNWMVASASCKRFDAARLPIVFLR